jgi:TolB protein
MLVGGILDGPAPTPGQAGVGGAGAIPTGPTWLFVVPLDGSAISQFGGSSDFSFTPGEYSPDMTIIAASVTCAFQKTCAEGIVAIDVASGTVTQLTTDADVEPIWSPDGRRIAFERNTASGRGIWVMAADGAGLTRLTNPPRPDRDHSVAWSPDGSSLLFSRGDTSATGLGDLYVLPVAGREPQLLINDAVGDW